MPAPRSRLSPTVIAAVAAVRGFLFGFDTAVINGAVAALKVDFSAGAGAIGFAVSAALLGCAARASSGSPSASPRPMRSSSRWSPA